MKNERFLVIVAPSSIGAWVLRNLVREHLAVAAGNLPGSMV